jgi:UDP-3-O-[3-hydroxymyristoyl] N-acetylglucosamine deacetylase/3-hydroxyacyl-[acyl-carrier-protein] dehydratase
MIVKTELQKTINKSVSLQGVGLHTGVDVLLTFKPATENTGYVFVRTDISPNVLIPADTQNVVDTDRGTNLEYKGVKIQTTEHVLASLVGLGIDNCFIEINSSEPPIMDGSSKFFVQALRNAGIKQQNEYLEEFIVKEVITYKDETNGSEIIIIPSEKTSISVLIDFKTKVLGTQNATLEDISDFETEIASSRTFSFLHELEMLLENGLIKGGDLNNAIIYVDKPIANSNMEKLKKAFNKEKISVNPNGILDNLTLHHHNEAARHKLLDVLGDMALIGMRVIGRIFAYKPGHKTNTNFSKKMSQIIKAERRVNKLNIDINTKPLMDVNQIMKILPHRPPFLLVDKIFELSKNHVVGLKNVTMNEPFFEGHFPGVPVMPGVLQIEAMAQAGGVLVLNTVPDPQNYLTFFMKIDDVKFKRPVHPGDTLILKLDLISPIRRGICHMKGVIFVNGQIATEGVLMAQIVHKNKIES